MNGTQDVKDVCDVCVIGAGVVGAAIAAALSRYELSTTLVDASDDVGTGTSKANTAILHTGFDAKPGTLESKLVHRGYFLLKDYAQATGIAVEPTGALLVAWTSEQLVEFPAIVEKAGKNGVTDLSRIPIDELYRLEPRLGAGALGGLRIPGESIICPFSPPIAYAKEAVLNGVRLILLAAVQSAESDGEICRLKTTQGELRARWVINAAGLHSDAVDGLFGHTRFRVTPRRGELIVFDKASRSLISHILLPVPTATTKGVLVSPTVFGNILLGPTAENLLDKSATQTTRTGLDQLLEKGRKILPALEGEEVTATYAGLRAATEHSDYQIHLDRAQRYVCVGGIRSTGLSASLGIAEYVLELLTEAGLRLQPKKVEHKSVAMPPLGDRQIRRSMDEVWLQKSPDYGRIVCHCEQVSRGEICDALQGPISAHSLDGLRRRTRCLQGRCQGFYCLAQLTGIMTDQASERSPHES